MSGFRNVCFVLWHHKTKIASFANPRTPPLTCGRLRLTVSLQVSSAGSGVELPTKAKAVHALNRKVASPKHRTSSHAASRRAQMPFSNPASPISSLVCNICNMHETAALPLYESKSQAPEVFLLREAFDPGPDTRNYTTRARFRRTPSWISRSQVPVQESTHSLCSH